MTTFFENWPKKFRGGGLEKVHVAFRGGGVIKMSKFVYNRGPGSKISENGYVVCVQPPIAKSKGAELLLYFYVNRLNNNYIEI